MKFGKPLAQAAVAVACDVHEGQPPGDILVFLAGQADVDKACRLISAEVRAFDCLHLRPVSAPVLRSQTEPTKPTEPTTTSAAWTVKAP